MSFSKASIIVLAALFAAPSLLIAVDPSGVDLQDNLREASSDFEFYGSYLVGGIISLFALMSDKR